VAHSDESDDNSDYISNLAEYSSLTAIGYSIRLSGRRAFPEDKRRDPENTGDIRAKDPVVGVHEECYSDQQKKRYCPQLRAITGLKI
jgi:hypothetical protein